MRMSRLHVRLRDMLRVRDTITLYLPRLVAREYLWRTTYDAYVAAARATSLYVYKAACQTCCKWSTYYTRVLVLRCSSVFVVWLQGSFRDFSQVSVPAAISHVMYSVFEGRDPPGPPTKGGPWLN